MAMETWPCASTTSRDGAAQRGWSRGRGRHHRSVHRLRPHLPLDDGAPWRESRKLSHGNRPRCQRAHTRAHTAAQVSTWQALSQKRKARATATATPGEEGDSSQAAEEEEQRRKQREAEQAALGAWKLLPSPLRELVLVRATLAAAANRRHSWNLHQNPQLLTCALRPAQYSKLRGFGSMWAGISPFLVATAASNGLYFYLYSSIRQAYVLVRSLVPIVAARTRVGPIVANCCEHRTLRVLPWATQAVQRLAESRRAAAAAAGGGAQPAGPAGAGAASSSTRMADIGALGSLLVASLAGGLNALATHPLWLIAMRQQVRSSSSKQLRLAQPAIGRAVLRSTRPRRAAGACAGGAAQQRGGGRRHRRRRAPAAAGGARQELLGAGAGAVPRGGHPRLLEGDLAKPCTGAAGASQPCSAR